MKILIYILYLIIPTIVGVSLYYWSSTFKRLATMSKEELNEDDELEEDKVTSGEANVLKSGSLIIFILIGIFVWSILGVTIGRMASILAPTNFLRWFVYLLIYFVFLRFPFGVANKMVKRSYDFAEFNEKIIFSLTMIVCFIMAICCYDAIPNFMKLQMHWLT